MRKQNSMSTRATWQKLPIFKIQDGGRPPFWKRLNRHISVKNCTILMKLGTLHQVFEPDDSHVTKNWNFLNSRWWRPPSWKSLFWPLLMNRLSDFSEILYEQAERHVGKGYGIKNANFKNPRWRTSAILKIVKSPYLSEKLSNFDEIRYTTANVGPDCSHVTKN